MSNTVIFLCDLVSISNPGGDTSVLCWWLFGCRRSDGRIFKPLQHDTDYITIFVGNIRYILCDMLVACKTPNRTYRGTE